MHWLYDYEMFWQVAPFLSPKYFGFTDWGNCNPKYALQPGLDLNGNEYSFENGKPVRKFMKYPDDVRLKKYKNLGNSKREGMFCMATCLMKQQMERNMLLRTMEPTSFTFVIK